MINKQFFLSLFNVGIFEVTWRTFYECLKNNTTNGLWNKGNEDKRMIDLTKYVAVGLRQTTYL